jgi:hypothetical protein
VFVDITETYGVGSFRAQGRSGSFSELLIVRDLRGNADVLTAKFLTLQGTLATHVPPDIDPVVYDQLDTLLLDGQVAYLADDIPLALTKVDAFLDLVEAESGRGIPDIWVSTGTLVNVAAKLGSAAATLRFSLAIEDSSVSDPADANRDGVVDALDVFYVINRVFPGGGSPRTGP